jgi:hypothetical protein
VSSSKHNLVKSSNCSVGIPTNFSWSAALSVAFNAKTLVRRLELGQLVANYKAAFELLPSFFQSSPGITQYVFRRKVDIFFQFIRNMAFRGIITQYFVDARPNFFQS